MDQRKVERDAEMTQVKSEREVERVEMNAKIAKLESRLDLKDKENHDCDKRVAVMEERIRNFTRGIVSSPGGNSDDTPMPI